MNDLLRDDAVDVLRDVLELWQLAETRWVAVSTAVAALAEAVRSRDADLVRHRIQELELVGPVRATGFGDVPTVKAPEPVRRQINELIHSLDMAPGSAG